MAIIKDISIVFMSIFLEAMPFVLLGAIISSIIEHFVSDDMMGKLIPKNPVLGSLFGILLGFFIPACDCAVIPVSRRLIKKKVPVNVAVSFMISSPIINPVALLSTYSAFYKINPKMFYIRFLGGILLSLVIGILMGIKFSKEDVLKKEKNNHNHEHSCSLGCTHDGHSHEVNEKNKLVYNISCILEHTIKDFVEVLKFLILGAAITSFMQVFVSKEIAQIFAANKILSIIVLMLFAYVISICSTSDSFVAKSLLDTFGNSGVIGFMLLSPMIDLKNTFILAGNYKKKFVITLVSAIFISVFISALILGGVLW